MFGQITKMLTPSGCKDMIVLENKFCDHRTAQLINTIKDEPISEQVVFNLIRFRNIENR